MKYLIVDDNRLARTVLKEMVGKTNLLEFIGECSNGVEAFEFLTKNNVDLVFLDVEMPGMSGIELMKNLANRPLIIFISAEKNYAMEAFDFNVADYLVKPFVMSRLIEAINKAQKIFDAKNAVISMEEKDYMFIKDKKVLKKIQLSDISRVEAMGDYIKVYTGDKWYMAHTSLRLLEEKLPPGKFMKVHRSYIVSLAHIDSIEGNAIFIGKASIPLAESYRSQLMEKLNLI